MNLKPDRNKRKRPQKRKGNNNSGDGNWKSKFRKKIKTDQGFKSIMSIIATKERENQALLLAVATSNSQLSIPGNQALTSELSA